MPLFSLNFFGKGIVIKICYLELTFQYHSSPRVFYPTSLLWVSSTIYTSNSHYIVSQMLAYWFALIFCDCFMSTFETTVSRDCILAIQLWARYTLKTSSSWMSVSRAYNSQPIKDQILTILMWHHVCWHKGLFPKGFPVTILKYGFRRRRNRVPILLTETKQNSICFIEFFFTIRNDLDWIFLLPTLLLITWLENSPLMGGDWTKFVVNTRSDLQFRFGGSFIFSTNPYLKQSKLSSL